MFTRLTPRAAADRARVAEVARPAGFLPLAVPLLARTATPATTPETGDYPGAAGDLEQAPALFRDLSDRLGPAEVLNETGTLHRATGEPAAAEAGHQQVLEQALGLGNAPDEAHTLGPVRNSIQPPLEFSDQDSAGPSAGPPSAMPPRA
jgi:hypothetical protein